MGSIYEYEKETHEETLWRESYMERYTLNFAEGYVQGYTEALVEAVAGVTSRGMEESRERVNDVIKKLKSGISAERLEEEGYPKIWIMIIDEMIEDFEKIKIQEINSAEEDELEVSRSKLGYLFAGSIYGRSYLSFEYALSYYGLIPENVYEYTSASVKQERKVYQNTFGRYSYSPVPEVVFPYGVNIVKEGDAFFAIACPEKAVCDLLYRTSPLKTKKDLEDFLFENMRIYEDEFEELDKAKLRSIAKHYNSANLRLLLEYLRTDDKM